jgi:death-on-curing protein
MNRLEPEFLSRAVIDAIHDHQIETYGGIHGIRDANGLESAIAAPQNVYYYADGDVFEIAAAYAYHLAESQAYLDGNKRAGVQAMLLFLEGCGIDTSGLPEQEMYDLMIRIAAHQADRGTLAEYMRSELGRSDQKA